MDRWNDLIITLFSNLNPGRVRVGTIQYNSYYCKLDCSFEMDKKNIIIHKHNMI